MSADGILIAIEGIDGAGKTTQVELLASALREAGETVLTSKEPTTGQHGQQLRDSASNGRLSLKDELALFIKDRQEHLQTKIRPALTEGNIVILDRYFYSTIAYQGARNGDIESLDREVRELADVPDVVLVLDIPAEVSQARIMDRNGTPNLFEGQEYLADVRGIFKRLVEIDDVVVEIDGRRTPEQVENDILAVLVGGVLREKRCAKSYGCDDPYHCVFRMNNTCRWWAIRDSVYSRLKPEHPEVVFAAR